MENKIMTEKEKAEYRNYVERLSGVDLTLEINRYPKTWSEERKILEVEKERREALLKQPTDYLENLVHEYNSTIEGYKELRKDFRPPYIYYLMNYELRKRKEIEERKTTR